MMTHGMLLGWKRAVPGKESQAFELFGTATAYWNKKKEEGVIESYEPVFLGYNGGNLVGYFMLRGEHNKLATLHDDEEFMNLVIRASILLEDFIVTDAYFGEGITQRMEMFRKNA